MQISYQIDVDMDGEIVPVTVQSAGASETAPFVSLRVGDRGRIVILNSTELTELIHALEAIRT